MSTETQVQCTCDATESLAALARLLVDHHENTSNLLDIVEHGNVSERRRATQALRVNGRTVATVAGYLVEPPSFDWHMHRSDPVTELGGSEWSLHT